MRSSLLAIIVTALVCSVPALGAEYDFYNPGQFVRYGGLVDRPDIEIQYVSASESSITLILSRRADDTRALGKAQLDLRVGETQKIFVKTECSGPGNFTSGNCRNFVVNLKFLGFSDVSIGRVRIEYTVEVMQYRNS